VKILLAACLLVGVGCAAARGPRVVLVTIDGGGHTWPGGPQYLPRFMIGRVCRDLDASDLIWDFFAKHPKP